MPTFVRTGATIAYTDTGVPPGVTGAQTVVFGHGLLFGGWMFRAQIEALRDRYRCVAIDWRGQGESPRARGGYDMDTLTADAVALLGELGVAPVHWVGLSMGGFVGQRIAARHGELVRSLTLLDTTAAGESPANAGRYKMLAWAQQIAGINTVLGKVKPLMFGPAFLADPAGAATLDEWAHRLRRLDRSAIRRAVYGVADRHAVEREITAITMPTLIVVGADDAATPVAEAERLAARIPQAELHIVPGSGHSSSLEQPDVVSGLLEKFLAGMDHACA